MAKEMKRVLRENTTVDTQTGEVLKRETTVQFSKEPGFVKLYFDCLGVYIKNDGLSASLNDMLLEVLHRASYAQDGQIVHLGAYDKEQICKATHKSMRRLEQAITTWVKNRVLIRVARGIYQVNPFIFGRGDWRDIANLRATFNFSKALLPLRDYKDGHYEELDTQNTSETHEDALEGASEQEQVGTPVTFPAKFSERMRAAISPTKFEAARSRFLLGATAFRTREMQKCASPFVEVRQIEFLARETPNYTLPRTCTHIPSMDMRA